jgi:hypothetical protein
LDRNLKWNLEHIPAISRKHPICFSAHQPQTGEVAVEINFGSGEQWHALPLPPLGSNVEDGEEDKWKVVCHEGCRVPVILQEHGPAAELNKPGVIVSVVMA